MPSSVISMQGLGINTNAHKSYKEQIWTRAITVGEFLFVDHDKVFCSHTLCLWQIQHNHPNTNKNKQTGRNT